MFLNSLGQDEVVCAHVCVYGGSGGRVGGYFQYTCNMKLSNMNR